MERILNIEQLISHGNIEGRKAVVSILEAGLQAADPYNNTKKLFNIDGNKLIVGTKDFIPDGDIQTEAEIMDLTKIDRIFVFGAGKGVQRIAKAIEDALGDHLTGGHIIDKKGAEIELKKIGVTLGAHPVPDEDCIKGCKTILNMTKDLTKNDLVFTIAANGISSLLTLPLPWITLEEVQRITYLMQVEHGVPTEELNYIRNHIDMMKGGQISRYIRPAKAIHLVAVGYDYHRLLYQNHWLHTLPDNTSFEGAINVLKKWNVWDETPKSIKEHLIKADSSYETVKTEEFMRYPFRVFILMPNRLAILPTVEKKVEELGYKPILISNWIQAEAKEAGLVMASIAKTIDELAKPFPPPCVLLSRGEFLVTVGKETGIGGRNQEFVLSMVYQISGNKNIVIGSVDTDGTDGPGAQFSENKSIPTLAGGIVDGYTAQEAQNKGVNIYQELVRHNTTPALMKLNCGILTTKNISMEDLSVILVQKSEDH